MRQELYSELRTIYETTDAYPHSLRVTMTMKDMVDGEKLKQAVRLTMKRYPYFCVRLIREGEKYFFLENSQDLVVINSYETITLEVSAVNGHFFVNFIQSFEEQYYFDGFMRQLRENNIDYDVMYCEKARYPGMRIP